MLQYGLSNDMTFYEYSHTATKPSSWNKYPTPEDPSRRYKFVSLEVIVGLDKLVVGRETYSLLDWLGDLGGLFDALFILCGVIISPVAQFSMKAMLLSKLFNFKPRDEPNSDYPKSFEQNKAERFSDLSSRKVDS